MVSLGFLTTSLIVVLAPGTGVIYTISNGILGGRRASVAAAVGCTLGIIPHLLACILGLSLLLHASALAFQVLKVAGGVYLLYLAWGMWREGGGLKLNGEPTTDGLLRIARKGFLINILNPKLSLFFLAFLPSFVDPATHHPTLEISLLSLVFMLMTLVVFLGYGLCAHQVRAHFLRSEGLLKWLQRSFAACLALLGLKLVATER